ncbi:uncharacterized protein [Macrobrachium rosenbergii]|uniref:uncharacterized protein n=1 Tax=Macrobrachium rosenbergii TaxID=79674 RepID=UPI0034D583DA
MRRNFSSRILFPASSQAIYLPEDVNFWTIAVVAVGTSFFLTVAISLYLICKTRLEHPLPVRHRRTVRHISQGPDALHPSHPYFIQSSPHSQLQHLHHQYNSASTSLHFMDPNCTSHHPNLDDDDDD